MCNVPFRQANVRGRSRSTEDFNAKERSRSSSREYMMRYITTFRLHYFLAFGFLSS